MSVYMCVHISPCVHQSVYDTRTFITRNVISDN